MSNAAYIDALEREAARVARELADHRALFEILETQVYAGWRGAGELVACLATAILRAERVIASNKREADKARAEDAERPA